MSSGLSPWPPWRSLGTRVVCLVQQSLQSVVSVTAIRAAVDSHIKLTRRLLFCALVYHPRCSWISGAIDSGVFIWKLHAPAPCDRARPPGAGPFPVVDIQLGVAQPARANTGAPFFHGRSMRNNSRKLSFPHAAFRPPLHISQVAPRRAFFTVVGSLGTRTRRGPADIKRTRPRHGAAR